VGSPFGCEDDGPPEHGGTRSQVCAWSYDLVPAETNATEDFAGYWVQIEVDPAPGWCVYGIHFETTGPDSGRLVSATPEGGKTGGDTTVELSVDADGAAPVPGTIAQDLSLPKGRVRTKLAPHHFSYVWSGKSRDKVVVALGVQVAYEFPPESLIYMWSEGVGVEFGTCRPTVLRVAGR
jgi:hypothetical protein